MSEGSKQVDAFSAADAQLDQGVKSSAAERKFNSPSPSEDPEVTTPNLDEEMTGELHKGDLSNTQDKIDTAPNGLLASLNTVEAESLDDEDFLVESFSTTENSSTVLNDKSSSLLDSKSEDEQEELEIADFSTVKKTGDNASNKVKSAEAGLLNSLQSKGADSLVDELDNAPGSMGSILSGIPPVDKQAGQGPIKSAHDVNVTQILDAIPEGNSEANVTADLDGAKAEYKAAYREALSIRSEYSSKPGYIREKTGEEKEIQQAKKVFGEFRVGDDQAMLENTNNGKGVTIRLDNGETIHFKNQKELFDRVVELNKSNGDFYNLDFIKTNNVEDYNRIKNSNDSIQLSSGKIKKILGKDAYKVMSKIERELEAQRNKAALADQSGVNLSGGYGMDKTEDSPNVLPGTGGQIAAAIGSGFSGLFNFMNKSPDDLYQKEHQKYTSLLTKLDAEIENAKIGIESVLGSDTGKLARKLIEDGKGALSQEEIDSIALSFSNDKTAKSNWKNTESKIKKIESLSHKILKSGVAAGLGADEVGKFIENRLVPFKENAKAKLNGLVDSEKLDLFDKIGAMVSRVISTIKSLVAPLLGRDKSEAPAATI